MTNVDNELGNKCPVCGYTLLSVVYEHKSPDYEICSCCGTEFGYHDGVWVGDKVYSEEHLERLAELRLQWINDGMIFHHVNDPFNGKPSNWDAKAQILSLPRKFLDEKSKNLFR